MRVLMKEFNNMQEFVDYKELHIELKEAGLWQRTWDEGKVYAQFLNMNYM